MRITSDEASGRLLNENFRRVRYSAKIACNFVVLLKDNFKKILKNRL